MAEDIYPVPEQFQKEALIGSLKQYQEMYDLSKKDPEAFWGGVAEEYVHWFKKWDKVCEYDWSPGKAEIKWFLGGKLNVSYNCLDKHIEAGRGDDPSIYWEGEPEGDSKVYTYRELRDEVCRFANVLKARGVKKGDRVCIYMPMIPELAVAMLACARIGAVHSIVFGGFSADSLRDRILDSTCATVVTTDGSYRSGKVIHLKENVDKAVEGLDCVKDVIVFKRTNNEIKMGPRDLLAEELLKGVSLECPAEEMDAEDPLFILYTSGSTGKPKGVLHTTGGYLTFVAHTHKLIFDYKPGDMYWCTADIGWVTGHSYIVYGPLCNGAKTLMFEGVPTYPDPGRFWKICAKYKVNQFYTAPTAIRALAKEGDEWPKKHDLSSLRLLGTVGEPINPEAWRWYYENIGASRCPIVDTWWQTETGGILITPLPGAWPMKPALATKPFFGVFPEILDEGGNLVPAGTDGLLTITAPWPGMMRTVYGDHQRFIDTYFSRFPGRYFTGDGSRVDAEGDYRIMGRVDDVINVSGHRMGTAEVESALVSHKDVAEAAVVGYPHEIKGQGIYAYVTLNLGVPATDDLKKELVKHVRKEIGPIASPDVIHWAPGLPKTRSGKIMRRILKKIAANELNSLGDTTTLADPSVVDNLVQTRA